MQDHIENATTAKTNGKAATEEKAVMELVRTRMKTANSIISIEKPIQRAQELNNLIDKWCKLGEARKNLTRFKLGADGLALQL